MNEEYLEAEIWKALRVCRATVTDANLLVDLLIVASKQYARRWVLEQETTP